MPAVQPPATVLVTGVSGFSGAWIARALLEDGFTVHGTVRSEKKAAHVVDLFKSHGDRFQPVIVPDISQVRMPSPFCYMRDPGRGSLTFPSAARSF